MKQCIKCKGDGAIANPEIAAIWAQWGSRMKSLEQVHQEVTEYCQRYPDASEEFTCNECGGEGRVYETENEMLWHEIRKLQQRVRDLEEK